MSTPSNKPDFRGPAAVTINFGERFAQSDQFDKVFKHGMALVERTAAYLDGPGRQESKQLKSPLTLIYATESMRLTTRLLELASWLLIRRGVKDGEITTAEAAMRRERVKLQPLGRPSHVKHFEDLPQGLRDLISESFALNDRILQLDKAITGEPMAPSAPGSNPVDAQMKSLHAAFGGPRLVTSTSTH
jgi:regulator of CtrA degradation